MRTGTVPDGCSGMVSPGLVHVTRRTRRKHKQFVPPPLLLPGKVTPTIGLPPCKKHFDSAKNSHCLPRHVQIGEMVPTQDSNRASTRLASHALCEAPFLTSERRGSSTTTYPYLLWETASIFACTNSHLGDPHRAGWEEDKTAIRMCSRLTFCLQTFSCAVKSEQFQASTRRKLLAVFRCCLSSSDFPTTFFGEMAHGGEALAFFAQATVGSKRQPLWSRQTLHRKHICARSDLHTPVKA